MFYPFLGFHLVLWIYMICLIIGTLTLWVTEYFFGAQIVPPFVFTTLNVLYILFIPIFILLNPVAAYRAFLFLIRRCGVFVLAYLAVMAFLLHTEHLVIASLSAYDSGFVPIQQYAIQPNQFVILCAIAGVLFVLLGWVVMNLTERQNKWINCTVKIGCIPAMYFVYMLFVPTVLAFLHPTNLVLAHPHFVIFLISATGLLTNFIWFEKTRDILQGKTLGWFLVLLCVVYALWFINPLPCRLVSACPVCSKVLFCGHWLG